MVFFWPFWWGYGIGALVWDIIGIALFFLVLYIFFRYGGIFVIRHFENEDKDMPCEILKRRYAAGEITKEEYERIKKDLDC
ncbi:MAG: hypothetical protein C0176_00440 [Mesoaciditoga sp.]|nr:MAG: hypothetical protein C0176_00440 [Mesoaciditoga sp.]HEU23868.1 hypothetical protein [Mesoaciditoga lauensis]